MNYSNNHINCSLFASRGSLQHPYELRNSFQSCHPRRTHLFFMLLRHNAPISKFHIDRQTRDKKKIRWDDIIHDEYDADIVDVYSSALKCALNSTMAEHKCSWTSRIFLISYTFKHAWNARLLNEQKKKLKTWTWAFKNTKNAWKLLIFSLV